jgi:MFS family permease
MDAPRPGAPPSTQPWPSPRTAAYTLFVLTVVVMFTVLDRQVLSLVIEPVKHDFGISDTQAALLLGAAFSLTYAIAGMPIARIADVANRRNLVAACMAFWCGATVACGVAQNYTHLFLARLCIGIGESGYGPATWSMVTDTYPRERVAFATSTLAIGAMTGTGLALLLGGAALALVSKWPPIDLPLIGTVRSWQWAFFLVGLPGLFWAVLVLTLKEPARRGLAPGQKQAAAKVSEVARYMAKDWRTYTAIIGGAAMKLLLGTGSTQWAPTLLRREFGWELSKIGMIQGSIMVVVSAAGLLIGGRVAQRWALNGRSDANLRVMFYGLLGSVPLSILYPLIPNPTLLLIAFAGNTFCAAFGTGPAIAAFQIITPNAMRAQVSSVSQFSTNVFAFAFGPLVVALFTDYLFHDPQQLKYSMSLSAAILGPITLAIVGLGLKSYARSYERAVREIPN